ncbi:hypothetical protein ATANTOWER_017446, partial [Ataeniobius toweri]|nr:hypothetical protein [Ataeniobius toweri]
EALDFVFRKPNPDRTVVLTADISPQPLNAASGRSGLTSDGVLIETNALINRQNPVEVRSSVSQQNFIRSLILLSY